jgi:endoglucanase
LSEYEWGSNSGVANKLMLMGLAYHFSKNRSYANGVTKGVDYLFGRNTFSTSFVTGEGTATVKQPHHRFWAGALNPEFPFAPPGALSGGPNAGLQDPVASKQLTKCVTHPATCWVDDIHAYSVNEVTINWNAPLAWLLDFQNDLASASTLFGKGAK